MLRLCLLWLEIFEAPMSARELFKSMLSFSLAQSLFGFQQVGGLLMNEPTSQSQQSASPVSSGSLNTSSFVVLGEGLAAGMGDSR